MGQKDLDNPFFLGVGKWENDFFPSFLHVGTAIWNFHSSESCDILEITTAEAKIVLPEFMNGRLVSVKSSDGSVLEEWEEAPPSTVQLPMIQSATWSQSPQYIYIYIHIIICEADILTWMCLLIENECIFL